MVCVGFFIFMLVIVVAVVIAKLAGQSWAKRAYLEGLERLKRDPHNPDLREQTLALGRRYIYWAMNPYGPNTFDEAALISDINAACSRPAVSVVRDCEC